MCLLIKYQTRPGHGLGAPGELRGPSTPLCLPGRLEARVQLLELRPARGWGPVLVDHGWGHRVRSDPGQPSRSSWWGQKHRWAVSLSVTWVVMVRKARGTSLGSGKASRSQKEETSDRLIKDRKE